LSSLGQWNSHHTTASVCNDAFRYLSDAEWILGYHGQ
jgi:hypothetical protein